MLHLVRPAERLQQSLAISVPLLSQLGAEAVFGAQEELLAAPAAYARNRAILLEELPPMGLERFPPVDGAFYVYPDVSRLTDDAESFRRKMLDEIGVAAPRGPDFDRERGNTAPRDSLSPERSAISSRRWGE
jgi:aspartate/methionine/tyrosine aminotransferase